MGPEQLRFYTVDAARNDLPWHFTALSVPRYPSNGFGEKFELVNYMKTKRELC